MESGSWKAFSISARSAEKTQWRTGIRVQASSVTPKPSAHYSPDREDQWPFLTTCPALVFLETTVEGFGAVQVDSLTMTRPPVGPGTAPWTKIRFLSLAIWTTSRLRLVTCSTPQWPAIFFPGGTPWEIECSRSDWPCVAGRPWKPHRRTTPMKPRPLEVPTTSTFL